MLERRFGMMSWFKRHGYPESLWQQHQQQPAARVAAMPSRAPDVSTAGSTAQQSDMEVLVEDSKDSAPVLLVFDFDRTLTNW